LLAEQPRNRGWNPGREEFFELRQSIQMGSGATQSIQNVLRLRRPRREAGHSLPSMAHRSSWKAQELFYIRLLCTNARGSIRGLTKRTPAAPNKIFWKRHAKNCYGSGSQIAVHRP